MSALTTYMLDTNICSFAMRGDPHVAEHLIAARDEVAWVVISAITYAELRYGAIGSKASPKHERMVNRFVKRLDGILAWDADAVDQTTELVQYLATQGTPIGDNDADIAGHALAADAILVTNNTREFSRVPGLRLEDWTTPA
jgi:tRNA(fMet)-specific endonuclease VapC